MSARPIPTTLHCHASSACTAVRSLTVQVRAAAERLVLSYALDADLDRLRVPSAAAAQRGHELWAHTCFESFVRMADAPEYCELNFAPSRAWAMYRFDAYRRGMQIVTEARTPQIAVRRRAGSLELDATFNWHDLIAAPPPLRLRFAAAAVLEDEAGRLSHWALRHPPGKPDFHHADGFLLELDL
jgi:hypothetical protein